MMLQLFIIFELLSFYPIVSFNSFAILRTHSARQRGEDARSHFSSLSAERLPWSNSVESTRTLTYMEILKNQMDVISKLGLKEIPLSSEFQYKHSTTKNARIGSMSFQNEQFRKVRVTYFDAGNAVQVSNK